MTTATDLPSYAPWPEDPAVLEAAASRLSARESQTAEVRTGLSALLGDPALGSWLGQSADAFRTTLGPVPDLLLRMADAYQRSAAALRRLAQQIHDGQAHFAKVYAAAQAASRQAADGSTVFTDPLGQVRNENELAVGAHDRALKDCCDALHDAQSELAQVARKLGDSRYSDFVATFVGLQGHTADLDGLRFAGADLFHGQVDAVTAALNGKDGGAIPPDTMTQALQDLLDEYGGIDGFWPAFLPALGRIPGYLSAHDALPDGSLPPADQALLTRLGTALAQQAAAGNLGDLVTTSDTAGLLGLSRLVATVPGRSFGGGPGAQFLADLVTKMTDATTSLPFDGPATDDYGPYNAALSIALKAATDNGDAVRLALSGPNGLTLATQLLEGATPVSETVGAYITTVTGPGWAKLTDAGTIAGFLDAGIMATRGTDPLTQQSMQAALNIVKATAAFSAWNPSNDQHAYEVGQLPDSITESLRNYATANMYDLAQSSMDGSKEGVFWDAGIPGNPLTFIATNSDVQTFLKVALRNPADAMGYQSLAEGKYTEAVSNAIQFGPFHDSTDAYANLVVSCQKLIDGYHISAAQQTDARNANHLLIANMLGGAFGNGPGPTSLGIAQSIQGLMQPAVGGGAGPIGHFFDTSHAAQAQQDAHQSDIGLQDFSRLLAAQGAWDAGSMVVVSDPIAEEAVLKVDGAVAIGPGMVADGRIQNNEAFQSWWKYGENVPLGHGDKLSAYVDKIQKAMTSHS